VQTHLSLHKVLSDITYQTTMAPMTMVMTVSSQDPSHQGLLTLPALWRKCFSNCSSSGKVQCRYDWWEAAATWFWQHDQTGCLCTRMQVTCTARANKLHHALSSADKDLSSELARITEDVRQREVSTCWEGCWSQMLLHHTLTNCSIPVHAETTCASR
jgi:hypothetical protein